MNRDYLQKVSETFYMFGISDKTIRLRNIRLDSNGKIKIEPDEKVVGLEKRVKSLDGISLENFSLMKTPEELGRREIISLFNRQTGEIESLYRHWDRWKIRGYLPVISFKKFGEKIHTDSPLHIKVYSLMVGFGSSRQRKQILDNVYGRYNPSGSIIDNKKVSSLELHPFEN